MPKHFNAIEREQALREAIKKAQANIVDQHEISRKLSRKAARAWKRRQHERAIEDDAQDDIDDLAIV